MSTSKGEKSRKASKVKASPRAYLKMAMSVSRVVSVPSKSNAYTFMALTEINEKQISDAPGQQNDLRDVVVEHHLGGIAAFLVYHG